MNVQSRMHKAQGGEYQGRENPGREMTDENMMHLATGPRGRPFRPPRAPQAPRAQRTSLATASATAEAHARHTGIARAAVTRTAALLTCLLVSLLSSGNLHAQAAPSDAADRPAPVVVPCVPLRDARPAGAGPATTPAPPATPPATSPPATSPPATSLPGPVWLCRDPSHPRPLENTAVARTLPEDLRLRPEGTPALPGSSTDLPLSLPQEELGALELPFGLDSLAGRELVHHYIRYYQREGRTVMTRWLARAGRYRALVEEEAARQGAPADLLWVAAVESGFDPLALSRVGAAGMWQFMPRTGRAEGMRIDADLDERLDIVTATRHGIAYLLKQQQRFGSWPLALAAYNAGSGHVRSEIERVTATDLDALERHDAVYRNARNYAARIIAIATIARNTTFFGFDHIVPDEPWRYDVVELPARTRLGVVAEAAGASLDELVALNPHLLRQVTVSDGQEVRLPPGSAGRFSERFDRIERRYRSGYETVQLRFGETIGHVAQRYGVPERVIRSVNQLPSRGPVAYGIELQVPSGGSGASVEAPPVVLVPDVRVAAPGRARIFYEVQAGDTLDAVAAHLAVDPWDLAAINDLDVAATLWPGFVLQVFVDRERDLSDTLHWAEDEVRVLVKGSAEHQAWEAAEQARSRPTRARQTHTVRSGDTVLRIARRYGVEPADIIRWNRLDREGRIVIGQELTVSP